MGNYRIIKIQEQPQLRTSVANWFHEKWNIPFETYLESIDACLKNENAIPQWYIAVINDKIVGGIGVIENDFHNRKDLAPNVCAVYVEKEYRCQGIAGKMLEFVCDDMKERNIDTLYLITDHTSFYERYRWEFLCMVQGDDEENLTRMYMHKAT